MRLCVILLFCFCLLISCFESNDVNKRTSVMKTYKDSFIELRIPQTFNIELEKHWEMGHIYIVKNSDNEVVMGTRTGGIMWHIGSYDKSKLTEDYVLNNKIDTVIEWNGNLYKQKIYVLLATRGVLEVSCYPDFADSLTCDNMVASIKSVH